MALSFEVEDAHDLELQREIEAAAEVFLKSSGPERYTAKSRYLALLRAFTTRVFERRT
jgi:hypothetical protein